MSGATSICKLRLRRVRSSGRAFRLAPTPSSATAWSSGDGCVLHAHAVVQGPSKIGRDNVFHPFCSVGGDPQDLGFRGEHTELVVGDGNTFREYVTVSRGTAKGRRTRRASATGIYFWHRPTLAMTVTLATTIYS